VPLEQTSLYQWTVDGQPVRTLHAEWPLISLSILYSDNRKVQTLIFPAQGFKPFDPYNESSLPNLQRFGVTYAPYLAALAARHSEAAGDAGQVR